MLSESFSLYFWPGSRTESRTVLGIMNVGLVLKVSVSQISHYHRDGPAHELVLLKDPQLRDGGSQ
jgi:hypothetical protein